MVTRVKICGITRREDAELAIELGAHALGFIFEPSSKRYLPQVPDWTENLPPYVAKVAVFGNMPATFADFRFTAIQAQAGSLIADPCFQRIIAIRCKVGGTVENVLEEASSASAILLDAHAEGQFGGTGKCIDWGFAAEVVNSTKKPVILAGGLTPENVAEAIRRVSPYAVDVSSGVEAEPGIKDWEKLRAFFEAARN